MKPISPRSLFNLTIFITTHNPHRPALRICSFSTQPSSHNAISSYTSRRQDEESRQVRVSVWWDFENCQLPSNGNAYRVAQFITNAVRANGIKGPVQINAFGDIMQLSRASQEALSSTGVNLTHIPSGGKNSADRSLLVDLMYWVSQNPPPAHVFLISGDRDFAGILHRLRMNNYNILLASRDDAPGVLCSAASIMWHWHALIRGENPIGRHFNQPPDGPYGSWYGHYKAPLEDPFLLPEQSSVRGDSLSESSSDSKFQPIPMTSNSDAKLRPIPKAVIKKVRQILDSYPKGIPINDLRVELVKSSVLLDKDLYGYKKFSRFLCAMPKILKLQAGTDIQFLVCGVNSKTSDEHISAVYSGQPEIGTSLRQSEKKSGAEDISEKSPLPPVAEQNSRSDAINVQEVKEVEKQGTKAQGRQRTEKSPSPTNPGDANQNILVKFQEPASKVEVHAPSDKTTEFAKDNETISNGPDENGSAAKPGMFRRMWTKWFGSKSCNSKKKISSEDDEISKKRMQDDKVTKRHPALAVDPALFSPSSHEAIGDGRTVWVADYVSSPVTQSSSIFYHITSWRNLWRSPDSITEEESTESANQKEIDSKKHQLFLQESFWNELEAFLKTSLGSTTVSHSKTRLDLVHNLQKEGPAVLSSLSEGSLLHLVDLLISHKKWLEEFYSRASPFKVILPAKEDSPNDRPIGPNGLSSIFSSKQQTSASEDLQVPGEKKHLNIPHSGVARPVSQRDSCGKSRSEILADCQKLVDHIVKEYPEGFNMGLFRKLFYERHGYALDLQKLGYQRLVSLLQILSGVKIESCFIVPAKNRATQTIHQNVQDDSLGPLADSDSESSAAARKEDDLDSSWEELGPVANACSAKVATDSGFTMKTRKEAPEMELIDYEPLREDDFSDSEEESMKSEDEAKSRADEEDSSLLQILDSWYSNRDADDKNDADCSKKGPPPSARSGSGIQSDPTIANDIRKHIPTKKYSFVLDKPEKPQGGDKLIDGILGSLKKSGEKSAASKILG